MKNTCLWLLIVALVETTPALAQDTSKLPDRIPSSLMTFFVTSEPIGDGGKLAGLAGADAHCALDEAASRFLQAAAARLGWSARSYHRVLRMARTVADLSQSAAIQVSHLAEAIQYRRVLAAQ